MSAAPLRFVILGLSITSSWGNGHATTYRGLVRALARRGHSILFLERDLEWYRSNRDFNPESEPGLQVGIYHSLDELQQTWESEVRSADVVIVGSYVPQGVEVGQWVLDTVEGITAFYDIDTPVTLAKLERRDYEYIHSSQIPHYDLYLSFAGGPTLDVLARNYGSPGPRALYCSVEPQFYYPEEQEIRWDLGYLGTYSDDRQPGLDRLLLEPARRWPEGRFMVAGPKYPEGIVWPTNVEREIHLPPALHRTFYNSQRFTLNITRQDMIQAGYSPSVRLFEAAACGVCIISDWWEGLDTVLEPEREILIAHSTEDCLRYLQDTSNEQRFAIARRGMERVLNAHTADHRAAELESYVAEARKAATCS